MATLGIILVVVGAALMVAEAHLPAMGVLGTGAAAALTAGVVRARTWEPEGEGVPLAEGSAVVVESIDGPTLTVRPAEEWEVR